jgi:hypothetical protein
LANSKPLTAHLNSAKRIAGPGRPKGSKNRITRERWEQEVRCIALSNIVQAFEGAHGNKRSFTLRELRAMPEEMQRAISSVKVRTENLSGGDGQQDTTIEIRLWDKTKALELGARANGWLTDKTEIVPPEALLSLLDRAKIRARGEVPMPELTPCARLALPSAAKDDDRGHE